MRRLILLAPACLVVLIAYPRQSRAVLATLDLSNLGQQIKNYAEMVKQTVMENEIVINTLDTIHEVQNDVQEVDKVLNQATQIYNSVTGVRTIGGAVSLALSEAGIQDPLPFSVGAIEGLMNQRNPIGLLNSLGSLGGAYTANTTKNTIWTPTNANSDGAIAMTSRIGVVSASQATAETLFDDSQKRLPRIRDLTNQINNAKDQAERERLSVLLQGEIAEANSATNEAMGAQMMANTSLAAEDLRAQQRQQQSLHEFNQQASALVGQ